MSYYDEDGDGDEGGDEPKTFTNFGDDVDEVVSERVSSGDFHIEYEFEDIEVPGATADDADAILDEDGTGWQVRKVFVTVKLRRVPAADRPPEEE
jgi:hypothetical protein